MQAIRLSEVGSVIPRGDEIHRAEVKAWEQRTRNSFSFLAEYVLKFRLDGKHTRNE